MHHIIPCHLVECPLIYFYRGSFTFYQQYAFSFWIEYQDIRTPGFAVEFQATFKFDERSGITFLIDEILNKMLPHPFFRSDNNVPFSYFVKKHQRAAFIDYFKRVWG